jgi:glycosyltransferase involved in cell wall biosynthesis
MPSSRDASQGRRRPRSHRYRQGSVAIAIQSRAPSRLPAHTRMPMRGFAAGSFQILSSPRGYAPAIRILIVHNSYEFAGGEDEAVDADRELLAAHGHETLLFTRSFADLADRGKPDGGPRVAADAMWSRESYEDLREVVRRWRPTVAHFHNIFPLISPSGYSACRSEKIPVVQTLHNYRLVCPAGTLLRSGRTCELCVGKVPWRAVKYRCYRGSRTQSLALASIITAHRAMNTWASRVDAYVVLSDFERRIFVRGGFAAERMFIRPNAVRAAAAGVYAGPRSALYVGRLSREKGIRVLLDAWGRLPRVPLTIIGDGPLRGEVERIVASRALTQVSVAGALPHDDVLRRLATAGMLVFPSLWQETFGLVVVEAFSAGVPVIATNLGAQAEIVTPEVSGLLVPPGDSGALADAVNRLAADTTLAERLSKGAREEFLARFSAERSYAALMSIYEHVGAAA